MSWLRNMIGTLHAALWSAVFGSWGYDQEFRRGAKITFVRDNKLKRGWVCTRTIGGAIYVDYLEEWATARIEMAVYRVEVTDRDIKWCYGWKGKAVDALLAGVALS